MSNFMTFTPFTNATLFTLKEMPECFVDLTKLQDVLSDHRMPTFTERTLIARGFINPLLRENDDAIFHSVDGVIYMTWMCKYHDINEGAVIERTQQRINELTGKGTDVTKELEEDIKETTRNELMPFMPVKVTALRAMVLPSLKLLVVDASSDKAAEDFTRALRIAIGGLRTEHLHLNSKPVDEMSDWLLAEYSEDKSVEPTFPAWPSFVSLVSNKMLHLENAANKETKARIQSFNISAAATQCVIEDMGVTQMPVSFFDDRGDEVVRVMDCNLVSENSTERLRKLDLRLKSIKLTSLPRLSSDELAEINGYYFLMAKTFEYVLTRLINVFGGVFNIDKDNDVIELEQSPLSTLFNQLNVTITVVSDDDIDTLLEEVKAFVIEERRCSVSGIQRKFKIGYNRAARLVEQLEQTNIVSQSDNAGKREVLAQEVQ